jgi:hypothetical protein
VITVVGFAITLYKLRQQRSAFEAAQAATKATLDEVQRDMLASHIGEVRHLVADFQSSCRGGDWARVHFDADRLRAVMPSLLENHQLSEDDRRAIGTAIDDIRQVSMRLLTQQRKSQPMILSSQNLRKIDEIVVFVGRLDARTRMRFHTENGHGTPVR